jgi:hypothetical protein
MYAIFSNGFLSSLSGFALVSKLSGYKKCSASGKINRSLIKLMTGKTVYFA